MTTIKSVKLAFKIIEPSVKKDKNDMILLHGISAIKEHFEDIASDLANQSGRKLYLLDARNHGDSEHSDVFNFDAMSADVINFMDEHGIKSASFFGHSMGGRLAMILALTHPERVESIIAEDITPKALPRKTIDGLTELMKLFKESINLIPGDADIETATKTIFQHVFTNKQKEILANAKQLDMKIFLLPAFKKDGKYVWKTNFPVIIKEIESLKFCEDLQGLSQKPALFLYGKLSEINVGNDEDFILKLFPKAQMHGLPTSHMVHNESPAEVLQAVIKFLE